MPTFFHHICVSEILSGYGTSDSKGQHGMRIFRTSLLANFKLQRKQKRRSRSTPSCGRPLPSWMRLETLSGVNFQH